MRVVDRLTPGPAGEGLYVTHTNKSTVVGFREDQKMHDALLDHLQKNKRLYVQFIASGDTINGKLVPMSVFLFPYLPGSPRGAWGRLTTAGEGKYQFSADSRHCRDICDFMKFGLVRPEHLELLQNDSGQPYAKILMPYKDFTSWPEPIEPVRKKKSDPAQPELDFVPVDQQLPDRDDVPWIHQLKEELNLELQKAGSEIQVRINDKGLVEIGERTETWIWR